MIRTLSGAGVGVPSGFATSAEADWRILDANALRDRMRPAPKSRSVSAARPIDHSEFVQLLVRCGIDSISVSPESFIAIRRYIADAEAAKG